MMISFLFFFVAGKRQKCQKKCQAQRRRMIKIAIAMRCDAITQQNSIWTLYGDKEIRFHSEAFAESLLYLYWTKFIIQTHAPRIHYTHAQNFSLPP